MSRIHVETRERGGPLQATAFRQRYDASQKKPGKTVLETIFRLNYFSQFIIYLYPMNWARRTRGKFGLKIALICDREDKNV